MFKVIRDFVPFPRMMVLCDRSCEQVRVQAIEPGVLEAKQKLGFIHALALEGWKIDVDEQVCPAHQRQERAKEPLVQVPKIVVPN